LVQNKKIGDRETELMRWEEEEGEESQPYEGGLEWGKGVFLDLNVLEIINSFTVP
jgi:hypothetical protein